MARMTTAHDNSIIGRRRRPIIDTWVCTIAENNNQFELCDISIQITPNENQDAQG